MPEMYFRADTVAFEKGTIILHSLRCPGFLCQLTLDDTVAGRKAAASLIIDPKVLKELDDHIADKNPLIRPTKEDDVMLRRGEAKTIVRRLGELELLTFQKDFMLDRLKEALDGE